MTKDVHKARTKRLLLSHQPSMQLKWLKNQKLMTVNDAYGPHVMSIQNIDGEVQWRECEQGLLSCQPPEQE